MDKYLTATWPNRKIRGITTLKNSGYNLSLLNNSRQYEIDKLSQEFSLEKNPIFLQQIHGNKVLLVDSNTGQRLEADASITSQVGLPLAILTADCVPVLFCNEQGTKIGAAHAGWKGISEQIVKNTILALEEPAENIHIWIGPGIGQYDYQVDKLVYDAFTKIYTKSDMIAIMQADGPNNWRADLFSAVKLQAVNVGVNPQNIYGKPISTYSNMNCYSHRRGDTGRMTSLIWINA